MKPAIRTGATRLVILTSRRAYKLPRPTSWQVFLLGLLANMQERTFARTGWRELCPVLWSLPGGWLVVMPRCEPLGRRMDDEEYAGFTRRGGYAVPVENKPDSFGIYQGRIVAIDYGS